MSTPRRFLTWTLAGFTLAAVAGLTVTPRAATAEKLPVDCSGTKSSCREVTQCIDYIGTKCKTFETFYWRWYI